MIYNKNKKYDSSMKEHGKSLKKTKKVQVNSDLNSDITSLSILKHVYIYVCIIYV